MSDDATDDGLDRQRLAAERGWERYDGRPTRPAFEPGNDLSLKHGGYSQAQIAERAREVRDDVLSVAPHLDSPIWMPVLNLALNALARHDLAHAGVVRAAIANGPDSISPRLLQEANAAANTALRLLAELGMTPSGLAHIRALSAGAQVSEASLADLAERGRLINERRDQALIEAQTGEDGDDIA